MVVALPHHHYSFQDYLAVEEMGPVRHEFLNGAIFAMAGGTPEHAALSAAMVVLLGTHLRGRDCRTYSAVRGFVFESTTVPYCGLGPATARLRRRWRRGAKPRAVRQRPRQHCRIRRATARSWLASSDRERLALREPRRRLGTRSPRYGALAGRTRSWSCSKW